MEPVTSSPDLQVLEYPSDTPTLFWEPQGRSSGARPSQAAAGAGRFPAAPAVMALSDKEAMPGTYMYKYIYIHTHVLLLLFVYDNVCTTYCETYNI